MKKFMDLKNLKLNKESALIVVLAGILCLVVVWPISGKSSGTDSSNGTLSGSSSSVSSSGRISEDTAQAALEALCGKSGAEAERHFGTNRWCG